MIVLLTVISHFWKWTIICHYFQFILMKLKHMIKNQEQETKITVNIELFETVLYFENYYWVKNAHEYTNELQESILCL
jgi:hypothetical protein